MEERIYFRANKDWAWEEKEWYIEEWKIMLEEILLWNIDEEDPLPTSHQLESILSLHWYSLLELLNPEEIDPFYKEF